MRFSFGGFYGAASTIGATFMESGWSFTHVNNQLLTSMKYVVLLLLMPAVALAQTAGPVSRRDSVPDISSPKQRPVPIPNSRPRNSFYRDPADPNDVVRATLDNMPVKIPDTTVYYPMPRHGQLRKRRLPK